MFHRKHQLLRPSTSLHMGGSWWKLLSSTAAHHEALSSSQAALHKVQPLQNLMMHKAHNSMLSFPLLTQNFYDSHQPALNSKWNSAHNFAAHLDGP